jgi:very-short-patch-repair endonuclease
MQVYYNPILKQLSRKLRKESTLSEVLLWNELKGKKILGYQFTRQKPIKNYIVDFYCSRLKLAIEIDGESHKNKEGYDNLRQKNVEKSGISFLRFYDDEIKKNMNGVLMAINEFIKQKETTPLPPLF